MKLLEIFQVHPAIPEPLAFLETLSRNLWWSWQHDANELFRRIEPRLWGRAERNPIAFLSLVPQKRYRELSEDSSFLSHLNRVRQRFESIHCKPAEDMNSPVAGINGTIAYFSMEFGIHESLPLYAGGLGMLAGDHLKAASDMALPLVGIGLLFRQGYFFQFLDQEGVQQEAYPEQDLFTLPLEWAKDRFGKDVHVSVTGPDGEIHAAVWKIQIGCVPLFLLDTNLAENPAHIRDITGMLYAGDQRIRMSQELLLGIGGIRALHAMGISPDIIHMNDGHCTFASLERLAQTIERLSVDLKTAMEIIPRTTVFTTHTPVAAGHDEFPPHLVRPCLLPYQDKLGVPVDQIVSWGQPENGASTGQFSMFVLGVRMAEHCNGVSRLHGQVARQMWAHVWPGTPADEVPIVHVTNGVHVPTWISYEIALLFERYLGPDWALNPWDTDILNRLEEIYAEELWRAHEMNRARLIRTCRGLMRKQYQRRNAPKAVMDEVDSVLDQDALTIGFGRRFASYKRSYLLLKDPDRLEALMTDPARPMQIIMSGKAHPRDQEGKDLIRRIIRFARKKGLRHRFIFLENYDPHIARHLVQGADIWLNTPRRPFEACGTSGMKAALNGVLNVSTLDGWWCEGYAENTGWRIGNGEEYSDYEYQDAVESQALYNVLENDVIPLFYDRKNGDAPVAWIKMMKASMKMAMLQFSSHKMMENYGKAFYLPASRRLESLLDRGAEEARRLSDQRIRLRDHWNALQIKQPVLRTDNPFRVGDTIPAATEVFLGQLLPEEVDVGLYYGTLKTVESLQSGHTQQMAVIEDRSNGYYLYGCHLVCERSGRYGFTARVTPKGDGWIKHTPGLITWAT